MQSRCQRRTEKCAGILLRTYDLVRRRLNPVRPFAHRIANDKILQDRRLAKEIRRRPRHRRGTQRWCKSSAARALRRIPHAQRRRQRIVDAGITARSSCVEIGRARNRPGSARVAHRTRGDCRRPFCNCRRVWSVTALFLLTRGQRALAREATPRCEFTSPVAGNTIIRHQKRYVNSAP